jgi:hypothetical protein
MPKIEWDIDQGSLDWYKLRATVPTASRFSDIITPKQMKMSASRKKYACQIIAARLLNWQADSLEKIEHIAAGKENEPLAVAQLELIREIETRKVGFVRTNDLRFGASPDRVMMNGDLIQISIECKCPTIPVQFEYLLAAELAAMEPQSSDAEVYKCQRQGQLFVCEADEAIFYSYNERMPAVYVRDHRDEAFIKKLTAALEQFSDELDALEERALSLGAYQAFAEILPPAEVEEAANLAA